MFSVVIFEVSHVCAVSSIGVTVLLLSVISLSLPPGNHPLMLFLKHMLLRIKQTSEVMARNRLFPSVRFNIEISAKLAVHTHTQ